PYASFTGHAHNNYLEHLATTGILGLWCLLSFHFFWGLESYRRQDPLAKLALPLVVSLSFSGLFQYTFGDGENLFFIMACYALSQYPLLRGVSQTEKQAGRMRQEQQGEIV